VTEHKVHSFEGLRARTALRNTQQRTPGVAATPRQQREKEHSVTASAEFDLARAAQQPSHLAVLGTASPRAGARTDRLKGGESDMTFRTWFDALRIREEGQTMAEYGVVLGVITIAAVGAFLALGGRVDDAINAVVALLP
jgi:Flp pilus assembly pilin Flp